MLDQGILCGAGQRAIVQLALVIVAGCSGGPDGGAVSDSGRRDLGSPSDDGGGRIDGSRDRDAGWHADVGVARDLGTFGDAALDSRPAQQPHIRRTGTNLFPNPHVNGGDGWRLSSTTATYDSSVSRTADGSGSLRFDAATKDWNQSTVSSRISVTPGKSYTFAAYSRSSVWPTMWFFHLKAYPSGKTSGSRECGTRADSWEESASIYVAAPDDEYVEITISRMIGPLSNGSVWVDDFYFGEGIGFEQPPTPKIGFKGTVSRFDELGNIDIYADGTWKPFFPFSICADNRRTDWSAYTKAGFNCISRSSDIPGIIRAKSAGMKTFVDVTSWASSWNYKDWPKLASLITSINNDGLSQDVVMYYFDNELEHSYNSQNPTASPMDIYETPKNLFQTIQDTELSINQGTRLRPLFMVEGQYGTARMVHNYYDMLATYTGIELGGTGGASGGKFGLTVLENIEGQDRPLFAQINGAVNHANIYAAIIWGAKGFSYWRDCVGTDGEGAGCEGSAPIESRAWFAELPQVRKEVDLLLPLIRTPHWTTWTVRCPQPSIVFGAREYGDQGKREGYLIVINTAGGQVSATFELEGLPYTPSSVKDYFNWSGPDVATFSGSSSFTVQLGPGQVAVYRLVNPSGPGKPVVKLDP